MLEWFLRGGPVMYPLLALSLLGLAIVVERLLVLREKNFLDPAQLAVLGELLAAALNVNGMLWRTGPAATELEQHVLDWLRQLLGLPAGWFGILHDTASTSTFHALAAARELDPALRVREEGLAGRPEVPRLRVYCSEEAHSSVEKAAVALGLGLAGVRRVATDAELRLEPAALEAAIAEDRAAGVRPLAVVATVGTTSTTAVDPVPAIAEICAREGLWLHVDAAYGGAAALLPEMRWVLDGCARADSVVVNPHKWLFTPMDCSALYTCRPEAFRRAFSLTPEYLASGDEAVNPMDYALPLGRRFRALKLWFVLRAFGREGLVAHLREHLRLARLFAGWVDDDGAFERLAPVRGMRTILGTMADPWTGWLLMRSLETLKLRMTSAMKNARYVAEFLAEHPKVKAVHYLGFLPEGDPQREVYRRQCEAPGSTFSFEIHGGEAEAFRLLNALQLVKLAVSLGGTESLAEHPATMTHSDLPRDVQEALGITPAMIRLSVGIEHVFVNGVQVIAGGQHTGAMPGRIVDGPGRR